MGRYILRRALLLPPTLFGVLVINFTVVQFAPGGPVEQAIAEMAGLSTTTTASISAAESMGPSDPGVYQGGSGLDPEQLAKLERHFGFDKPPHRQLSAAKANLQAPWLGITVFVALAVLLTLLIFIGEAIRDALDPRRALGPGADVSWGGQVQLQAGQ